jgi:dihydroorotate dehydrogenase
MTNLENHPLNPGEGIPVFISAGVLKEPAQLERFMDIQDPLAAPLLELGGFTMPEWSGNAKPGEPDFVYYPERRMAGNARGLPNPGKEGIKALKEPIARLTDRGIKTIIQVTNLPHETPLDVIPDLVEIAAESNPTGIEVNLSCPNGKKPDGSFHAPLCNDADASGEVMQASRQRVGWEVMLGAKDSPHVTSLEDAVDTESIKQLAIAIGPHIGYVVGINTIGGQPFPEITCAGGKGGMSGPVVAEIAKQHLRAWREYAPEIPYLSVGGVDSANAQAEIAERLQLGALLVGGAQEFYRAAQPHMLVERWAQAL